MAVSNQDVAFVGAIAAVVAAVAGPLTAWLVASSTRSHDERLRYDIATEDAYRSLLRAVHARSARLDHASGAVRRSDRNSSTIVDGILARDGEYQEVRATFELFASAPVAAAYTAYLEAWSGVQDQILGMTFSEDQHLNNVSLLFRAKELDRKRVKALREAVANDLSQRYAGPARRRRRAVRNLHRVTQHHDRPADGDGEDAHS